MRFLSRTTFRYAVLGLQLFVPTLAYRISRGVLLLLVFAGCSLVERVSAQELEPRAYSPNPVGINFVALNYGRSDGDVVFDASSPVQDVQAQLDSVAVGYGRTFGVWNRAANFAIVLPSLSGRLSGTVDNVQTEIRRSGLGDARLRVGMNLLGAPVQTLEEYERHPPRTTTLGASLVIVAPTGQYDASRLINIGGNRWAFKPEIGVSHPVGRWYFDVYAGLWLFTNNNDYYGGLQRAQDPITSLQLHVSYTMRRGLWLAADATRQDGGSTHIDGVAKADRQSNTRVGLTLSLPLHARQSLKLAWSKGVAVRFGGNFTTVLATWQYQWFD